MFYPAAASQPVAASSFRYDPSLGDLEQLGEIEMDSMMRAAPAVPASN